MSSRGNQRRHGRQGGSYRRFVTAAQYHAGLDTTPRIIRHHVARLNSEDVCNASGWYGEETLDVEAVHTMAPGAKIR